jgi:hypothetical protein
VVGVELIANDGDAIEVGLTLEEVEEGKRTRNLLELRKGSGGSGMMGILWGRDGR